MAFRIDPAEPLAAELGSVARSQLKALRRDLARPERRGEAESVHDARKRAKKLRALARLLRPALGELYKPSNAALRDTARELSDLRDTQVLVETIDALCLSSPVALGVPDLSEAREEAAGRHRRSVRALGRDGGPISRAREALVPAGELLESWELPDGFEAVAEGVHEAYSSARDAFRVCCEDPSVESFHQYRKRVKYHRYHLELLAGTGGGLIASWSEHLHGLSDLLGDDHDLWVLVGEVRSDPDSFGGADALDAIEVLATGRSAKLRSRAMSFGSRLTTEDPDAVVSRIVSWWEASLAHGPMVGPTRLAELAGRSPGGDPPGG